MQKIKRFITPLALLSAFAFLYGLCCMIFSDKHGWLALSGILLLVELAVPSLIANVVINLVIKNRKVNLLVQLIAVVIILGWYYEENGVFGLPFINNAQNYINNHNGSAIDTTELKHIDSAR